MLRTSALLALALAVLIVAPQPAAAKNVDSRVTHVTLYRSQAQITRGIPLDGPAGSLEIVVGDLPEQIISGSLFAEGSDGVEIRAVRFRTRAVGEEPREEVRKLDEQIRATQQQVDLTAKRQVLLAKRGEYLDKLEGFVAPTATNDLTKGVLDAAALERITSFAFKQREQIAQDDVTLAREAQKLNEDMELLQRKRAEITAGASRTIREAILFLQKNNADEAKVQLNYLVNNCGWSPTYTMRSATDRKQVRIEYNALIQQLTGEDWSDVTLTLSTASPALSAAGPGLAPFHVTLGNGAQVAANAPGQQQSDGDPFGGFGGYGRGMSKGQVQQQLDVLGKQRAEAAQMANNAIFFADRNRFSWSLNDFACTVQQLELNGDQTALEVLRAEYDDEGDGPSLTYELPGGVSLASRSDQQMVRIMATDMASEFYHVAVPVLNSYVYREAELKNTGDKDLLAGPMTVYLDGRFVGQGEIPTVARGQSFVVGFGADPQLRARRELVEKEDHVQGGNRETRFEYRLVVENFSVEAADIRVLDRLPHAENGADIRITLGETSDPLSKDKLYVREERPMGILRWDIEAPAEAAGDDARLIEYRYAVEYDRQYVVSLPEGKQSLQEEFERLQRERQKRGG